MSQPSEFSYIRHVDFTALAGLADDERFVQNLLDRSSGADSCGLSLIRTPPGGGSKSGLHTHEFEQIYYLLEGAMSIEINGETSDLQPGDVAIFPQGVPHRNWTTGDQPTLHLSINTPAP